MKKLLVGVCVVLLGGTGWAGVILDNFDSGTVDYESNFGETGTPVGSGSNSGLTCWGGTRDWIINVSAANQLDKTYLDIYPVPPGAKLASWTNGAGIQGQLILEYGSYTSAGPQNWDWTDYDGLRVEVMAIDAGTGLLTAEIDVNGTTYTSATPVPISGPYGPGHVDFDVLFSDFPGLPGVGDIDGVRYIFTTSTSGWDVTLESVGLTPEPTTLALLGIGALALGLRRRRK